MRHQIRKSLKLHGKWIKEGKFYIDSRSHVPVVGQIFSKLFQVLHLNELEYSNKRAKIFSHFIRFYIRKKKGQHE